MAQTGLSRWDARQIMKSNFMDYTEVCGIFGKSLTLQERAKLDFIPFSPDKLIECKDDYVLFPGLIKDSDGRPLTMNRIISRCSKIPGVRIVQSKYSVLSNEAADITKMDFAKRETCEPKWYLLRRGILENSLLKSFFDQEERFTGQTHVRERAVVYIYAWLIRRLISKKLLFNDQAVWCADTGDQDFSRHHVYIHFQTNKILIAFGDPYSARNRLGLLPSIIPDDISDDISNKI